MRIGFLFNHDQLHQVAHSLPIGLALAAMGSSAEIVLAATNERIEAELRLLAGDGIGRGSVTIKRLDLRSAWSRVKRKGPCRRRERGSTAPSIRTR